MELQSFELRLLHITVYTIHNVQRTSEIMYNLCTNSMNDLGKSFSHILKYREISSLLNIIPNCDTTYQLPYLFTKLWYYLPLTISIYLSIYLFIYLWTIYVKIRCIIWVSMAHLCACGPRIHTISIVVRKIRVRLA